LLPRVGGQRRRRHLRPARPPAGTARSGRLVTTHDGLPVEELARALYQARRDRVPIPPLTEERPGITVPEAAQVQRRLVELLQADGEGGVVGYKLGLTSRPMQEQLGIDQPDYGPGRGGGGRPRRRRAKVRGESGIVLGARRTGPSCTALEVRRAAAGVVAAVEIIDSRVRDW